MVQQAPHRRPCRGILRRTLQSPPGHTPCGGTTPDWWVVLPAVNLFPTAAAPFRRSLGAQRMRGTIALEEQIAAIAFLVVFQRRPTEQTCTVWPMLIVVYGGSESWAVLFPVWISASPHIVTRRNDVVCDRSTRRWPQQPRVGLFQQVGVSQTIFRYGP